MPHPDAAKAPPHPGKTPAQRRALDAIGCGNHSPIMARSTRDALLKADLIRPAGHRTVGTGPLAARVEQFDMPISVHMAWCAAVAHGVTDADLDAAFGVDHAAP